MKDSDHITGRQRLNIVPKDALTTPVTQEITWILEVLCQEPGTD